MKIETTLIIIGSFGTIALSINAFFLKGIYSDLNDVKIQIAKIFARSEAKEKRITDLEVNQKEMIGRLNRLERKIQ